MSDLRQRARESSGGGSRSREQANEEQNARLRTEIVRMQDQFQLAMPRGVEAAQLVRDALTELRRTPKLAACDPVSVLGSLMTCAQLGLRPGVLGHAWLLPFWDSKSRRFKAQLVIGYQGLCELAYRSDRIAGISAQTVYSNDEFTVQLGTDERIDHTPARGARGEPIAYYCVAHVKDGRPIFWWAEKAWIEHFRDRYAMARTKEGVIVGPWADPDQFEAMAKKTCLKQLAKWMPKSTDLSLALEADEGIRLDLDPGVSAAEATHHFRDQIEAGPEGGTVPGEVVPEEPTQNVSGSEDPDPSGPEAPEAGGGDTGSPRPGPSVSPPPRAETAAGPGPSPDPGSAAADGGGDVQEDAPVDGRGVVASERGEGAAGEAPAPFPPPPDASAGSLPVRGDGEDPGPSAAPAGDRANADPAEAPPPRQISRGEQRLLSREFSRLGLGDGDQDREERLRITSVIVGRDLDTSSSLSAEEGRTVRDTLTGAESLAHLLQIVEGIRAAEHTSEEGAES